MIFDGIVLRNHKVDYHPKRIFYTVGSVSGVFDGEFPRTSFRTGKMEVMITIPFDFKPGTRPKISIAFVNEEEISCDWWIRQYAKNAIFWIHDRAEDKLIEAMKPYMKRRIY